MIRIWRSKQIPSCVLALLLLMGVLFGNVALAATSYTGTTTTDVNVRSAPSSKSTKIGSVKKGTKVTLTGSVRKGEVVDGYTADMHFFKLSTGGYVAQAYVSSIKSETTNSATSSTVSTPANATENTNQSDDGAEEVFDLDEDGNEVPINIITPDNPTSDDTIIDDSVPQEDPGIADDEPEVLEVQDESPAVSTTTSSSKASGVRMVSTTSNLNVRSSPSTSANVTRKLSNGQVVIATTHITAGAIYDGQTIKGNWYRLSDGNYVSGDYLKKAGNSTVTSVNATKESTKSITTAKAKVDATYYASPSLLAFKRGTMKAGDVKDVSTTYKDGSTLNGNKVSGTWYKLSNGLYVRSSDVTIGSRSVASTTTVKQSKTTLVVGDQIIAKANVNVRSGPGTSYSKLKTMSSGTKDTVTAVAQNGSKVSGKTVVNGWVKLKNQGGYVQADYLKYAEGTLEVIGPSTLAAASSTTNAQQSQADIEIGIPEE